MFVDDFFRVWCVIDSEVEEFCVCFIDGNLWLGVVVSWVCLVYCIEYCVGWWLFVVVVDEVVEILFVWVVIVEYNEIFEIFVCYGEVEEVEGR